MIMEIVQTTKASLPAVPAMPPIENSTRAGTPLATQNAPRQSMARCSVPVVGLAYVVVMVFPRSGFDLAVQTKTATHRAPMHGGVKEPKWCLGALPETERPASGCTGCHHAAACGARPPKVLADASKFDVAQRGHANSCTT